MGRIVIAGLGPGETPHLDPSIWQFINEISCVVFRTEVHPGAGQAREQLKEANPRLVFTSFDELYASAESFDLLYSQMATSVVTLANACDGDLLYLVPGSPLVAEKSVDILRKDVSLCLQVLPGVSFLELVWSELSIDPFETGVTMLDASDFQGQSSHHPGPFLLTQVWSKQLLSTIKLAVDEPEDSRVIVLQRLGTASRNVESVAWDELDRSVEPDHLTTLYIDKIPSVPGPALVELYEIIARLRRECPWDQEQTFQSLSRHLLEESYEVIDVIEKMTEGKSELDQGLYEELKGELGDLLVQVYFYANLALEEGQFSLADVAETVTKKLIRRHPHVFTDLEVDSVEEIASNWERIKQTQEGRGSVLDGIPQSLPALLLASKLHRRATAVGIDIPLESAAIESVDASWNQLQQALHGGESRTEALFGELLWELSTLSKSAGVDLETAFRRRAKLFMGQMRSAENGGTE